MSVHCKKNNLSKDLQDIIIIQSYVYTVLKGTRF